MRALSESGRQYSEPLRATCCWGLTASRMERQRPARASRAPALGDLSLLGIPPASFPSTYLSASCRQVWCLLSAANRFFGITRWVSFRVRGQSSPHRAMQRLSPGRARDHPVMDIVPNRGWGGPSEIAGNGDSKPEKETCRSVLIVACPSEPRAAPSRHRVYNFIRIHVGLLALNLNLKF